MDCILRVVDLEMWMRGFGVDVKEWGEGDTYGEGRGKRLFMNAALVDGKGM